MRRTSDSERVRQGARRRRADALRRARVRARAGPGAGADRPSRLDAFRRRPRNRDAVSRCVTASPPTASRSSRSGTSRTTCASSAAIRTATSSRRRGSRRRGHLKPSPTAPVRQRLRELGIERRGAQRAGGAERPSVPAIAPAHGRSPPRGASAALTGEKRRWDRDRPDPGRGGELLRRQRAAEVIALREVAAEARDGIERLPGPRRPRRRP